ncbi:[protein release factor]-glutamine N5-methyltransferase [Palleronia aestuarii]|uniref:Release factor glutamine methyltransferase n=1 Tax=Palleronia aestuarii TaxID=568105 RepID=A0A2W7NB10_9RHOB|nr:peptide chain release factor N(5)-glutamine methyltransferase [Palleronia aestuarii]PZX17511.1 [protein release factor]-glutamine N5-methyltransferase [Palleronia aestuarii]
MSPPRLADLLREGAAALARAGIEGAPRDARHLLAFAAGISRDRLTLVADEPATPDIVTRFDAAIARRAARCPVSRILGRRDFFGREFEITEDVLDPRPETESLVLLALERRPRRILDLGTGSGCLLATIVAETSGATGLGTDISDAALDVARRNAAAVGVADRTEWRLSDWFGAVTGRFDLVVSNPPYIAAADLPGLAEEVRDHDPFGALSPGEDALAAYRAILSGARHHLDPDGALLVEIGAEQGADVVQLFRTAGFGSVAIHPDLDGRDRVVSGRLIG